ncbi:MAG: biotin transporter BioY [Burkholderiales bacterium]|nr:biotin transporter BioY [Burkholderiales bacterium]
MSSSSTVFYPPLLQAYCPTIQTGIFKKALIVLLGSVALAVSAKLALPVGVIPFTMQTYVVMVLGALLGSRLATASGLLYLAEGLAGLPVFASGGGWAYLSSPSFGFLLGFIVAMFFIGWMTERGQGRGLLSSLVIMTLGHAILFAFGVAYLSASLGLYQAYQVGFAPFILASIIKTVMAALTVAALWRIHAARRAR